MSSFRQIEANRRNARHSTGPITEEGKLRSRRNAVRHGLTAETVIGALEDAKDYSAFEAAVIADYDAQSSVERELVLRLASLLWRIRRATTMETGLFEIQAKCLIEFRRNREVPLASDELVHSLSTPTSPGHGGFESESEHTREMHPEILQQNANDRSADLAYCFLRLANLTSFPLDRLSRYEATLWRQAAQTIFALDALQRRTTWERRRFRPTARTATNLEQDFWKNT
jgi:hypothetical protein